MRPNKESIKIVCEMMEDIIEEALRAEDPPVMDQKGAAAFPQHSMERSWAQILKEEIPEAFANQVQTSIKVNISTEYHNF